VCYSIRAVGGLCFGGGAYKGTQTLDFPGFFVDRTGELRLAPPGFSGRRYEFRSSSINFALPDLLRKGKYAGQCMGMDCLFDARENWWGENPLPKALFLGPVNLEPWLEKPEPEAFSGGKP
jgi:hypothetical protein